jgi:hypothetical protein
MLERDFIVYNKLKVARDIYKFVCVLRERECVYVFSALFNSKVVIRRDT